MNSGKPDPNNSITGVNTEVAKTEIAAEQDPRTAALINMIGDMEKEKKEKRKDSEKRRKKDKKKNKKREKEKTKNVRKADRYESDNFFFRMEGTLWMASMALGGVLLLVNLFVLLIIMVITKADINHSFNN